MKKFFIRKVRNNNYGKSFECQFYKSVLIGSKTTDECGDEWRPVHTSGYRTRDEYIRVPRGQETSTYDRRRVHTTGEEYIRAPRDQETSTYDRRRAMDEYIRVPRGQETSTYDRRRVHTSRYKSKELS